MANHGDETQKTKQQPVDAGIENAKEQIEEASSGEFKVDDDIFSELQTTLREIWEEREQNNKIPEEFASALFELVALTQFQRIKDGNQLWDKAELEKVVDSFWDIIKRWLTP